MTNWTLLEFIFNDFIPNQFEILVCHIKILETFFGHWQMAFMKLLDEREKIIYKDIPSETSCN